MKSAPQTSIGNTLAGESRWYMIATGGEYSLPVGYEISAHALRGTEAELDLLGRDACTREKVCCTYVKSRNDHRA